MRMADTGVVDGFTLEENGAVLRRLHGWWRETIPPPYQGGG